MAILTTTKKLLRYPDLAQAADLAFLIQILAQDTDAYTAGYSEDVFANRPAAGKSGQFFWSTDTQVLYVDDGAAWHIVGFVPDASVTLAKLAANSVDTSKIVDGTIVTADIANLAVTSAKQAAGAGRAEDYGAAFPTTGLYNGYRFTIFLANPDGGQVAVDCIYRSDLDGTLPWHATGAGIEITGSLSGTWSGYSGLSASINTPRRGDWIVDWDGSGSGSSQGAAGMALYIAGSNVQAPSGSAGNSVMAAGKYRTGDLANGTTIQVVGNNSGVVAYGYNATLRLIPLKMI